MRPMQAERIDAKPVCMSWIRRVAWLTVVAMVAWLLTMTLRPGGQLSLPGVHVGTPASEINLLPFSQKAQVVRRLLASGSPWGRRAARAYLFVDVFGNIAVFVPFGAALAVAACSRRSSSRPGARCGLWIVAAGMLLSLSIELIQLTIPGRASDVDDVILNTLGTAIGVLAAWGFLKLMCDRRDHAPTRGRSLST
jgi:glycopeptide antibiotics resistance protein